jgi:multisubunit Na+/H+ antiporter MnhB subunit
MWDRPWFMTNELLAFVVELAALVLLARWGYRAGDGGFTGVVVAVVVLAVAVTLWALFAAPKARFKVRLWGVLAVKALVLLGSAAALHALGHPVAAAVWAAVVVVNTGLAETFRRRG